MNTDAMQREMERKGGLKASALTVPCRGPMEARLEELKARLLEPIVKGVTDSTLAKEIAWAAQEAAALAWYTACPILVLPVLLEEKVLCALKKWEKQQRLRRCRTRRGRSSPRVGHGESGGDVQNLPHDAPPFRRPIELPESAAQGRLCFQPALAMQLCALPLQAG
jgi:hypothetical protein